MKRPPCTITGLAVALLVAAPSLAGERTPAHTHAPAKNCCNLDPWTGEGFSLGGIFFPEVNYQAAGGSATTDPERLAVGHHDPDRHGITQQNIEFAVGARVGKHVRLFGNYNAKIDQDDHWHGESEEHYLTIDGLPLDARIKGGRFFTQFGYHNREHLHDYTFIDKYLANGRFIGEDSASIYGGELSLPVFSRALPTGWSDRLVVSYGAVPDPEEEGHEHEGPESLFEGEGATWQDWLATADYTVIYSPRESVRYEAGLSAAWGRNNFGRHTQVYGLHFEYLWLPSGVAHVESCCHKETAEFFRWRTEVFVRHFGAAGVEGGHDEHEEEAGHEEGEEEHAEEGSGRAIRDDFTDAGIYTALSYGFPAGNVHAHLRAEYVSGIAEAGLPERYRISPAVMWRPSERMPFHFKLQYNYDHLPSFGNEHSIWAQFSLTWGDCCAHEG
jgi:hypothetical protein